ncbi:MAG: chemotaxis protein CheW [Clostridia bacterium]|nr:chemotaxis protein CheW [Clostridia bacterium]
MAQNVEDIFAKFDSSAAEGFHGEKYLTFFIGEQLYAIPSSHVTEIIRMQTITFMPKLPSYIKGVINLRGKIVPVIDLRLKLNMPSIEYDEHTSIIIVETADTSVGLVVDGVNDVPEISDDQISDLPKLSKESSYKFATQVATVEDKTTMLLDIAHVVSHS